MLEDTAPTLMHLLLAQAARHRDRVAFRFCPDGGEEHSRLTYHELDIKARAIASGLREQGATGRRVLVFCRPGIDSIAGLFGCFYAGAVAIPVDELWPSKRAAAVILDARADFALATAKTQAKSRTAVDSLVEGRPLRWCALDQPEGDAENWAMPRVDAGTTAVMQYTSGSTGSPKGVMLTHRNYLHNVTAICQAWRLRSERTPSDDSVTGVSWLPHFHDMGFVGGVLAPLCVGGTAVLLSPPAFFMRPIRWLEAMSHHRAVVSAAPNIGYHLCVKRSSAEERAALDLSNWSVAVNGGGPVSAATLQDFTEAFAPAGFRPEAFVPAYGLAEATLAVSGESDSPVPVIRHVDRCALGEDRVVDAAPDDATAATLVGCGRPGGGQDVVIVDRESRRRCRPDEVGEIWVAGPSVAHGYWRKPEESERTFSAFLADTGEGPFLRTGDLGFLRCGELFVTGRCQDLITIDGVHYYPNDIEGTVQGCDAALLPDRGAAFTVQPSWDAVEQLVVVQEVHRHRGSEAELADLIDAIRSAIAEHHKVEAHTVVLVKPMRLPTTTSGKIQRNACRQRFLDRDLEAVAQWQAPPAGVPPGKGQLKAGVARLVGGALLRRYWDLPRK